MIGEEIASTLEVSSADNEIIALTQLLYGAEAVVFIFLPFCYGELVENTMEYLITDINKRIDEFNDKDIRVICITREAPSTIRHWISDRDLQLEVFSDASLEVSNALVGTFDLSVYMLATKGVQMGSYFVSSPGIIIVGGDGKIMSKYVANTPDTVKLIPDDILQMINV